MPSRKTVEKARRLRRTMTPPEVTLWQILRTRPDGLKFRHQHPNGLLSLDFYCASAKLAIEVDGEIHNRGDAPAQDAARDEWLAGKGIRTLRIAATDVQRQLDAVMALILHECRAIPLHHPADGPLPHSANGEE